MQVVDLNGVVPARLPQENVSMPSEVKAAIADLWQRIGAKKKWAAYTAAILAFYRLSEEEQYQAMDAVEAARRRKNFESLLRPEDDGPIVAAPPIGRPVLIRPPKPKRRKRRGQSHARGDDHREPGQAK